jgi:hypothetical protein
MLRHSSTYYAIHLNRNPDSKKDSAHSFVPSTQTRQTNPYLHPNNTSNHPINQSTNLQASLYKCISRQHTISIPAHRLSRQPTITAHTPPPRHKSPCPTTYPFQFPRLHLPLFPNPFEIPLANRPSIIPLCTNLHLRHPSCNPIIPCTHTCIRILPMRMIRHHHPP